MSKSIRHLMSRPVQDTAPDSASSTKSTTSPPLSGDSTALPPRRASAARSFGAMWQEREQTRIATDAERDGSVVELDPDLCDPSAIADRVPDTSDAGFTAFVEQLREEGQRSPALVRPKPDNPGRYEIAYGRRRLRAAKILGRPLRAIVQSLSDTELLIAQGSENLARADLSYIERAHFAHNMVRAGVARDVIAKAMGTQSSNVSSYLAVAEKIPTEVLAVIGPAPGVGRPRWVTLVERIKGVSPTRITSALASPDLAGQTSDGRFSVVLAALTTAPKPKARPSSEPVKDAKGVRFARVERSATGLRVTVEENAAPGFGDYLADRLPEILAAYRANEG